jgi:hypothetical protein
MWKEKNSKQGWDLKNSKRAMLPFEWRTSAKGAFFYLFNITIREIFDGSYTSFRGC